MSDHSRPRRPAAPLIVAAARAETADPVAGVLQDLGSIEDQAAELGMDRLVARAASLRFLLDRLLVAQRTHLVELPVPPD